MFVAAIERASQFTRPIHSVMRIWGSSDIIPGAATLFMVNAEGWALTCAHVARQLMAGNQIAEKYRDYTGELAQIPTGKKKRKEMRALARKYDYKKGTPVELRNNFVNCVSGPLECEARIHSSVDLALLKFSHFTQLLCEDFPVFAQHGSELKQGKSLCRLGFPFPEFTNFEYDVDSDQIRWTETGRPDTPCFPIEGMVTRHLLGQDGFVFGFELSTPGLKGQSGGPAFDPEGRVWGMQSATRHLDLDFDVDVELLRAGQKQRVQESAFLHVGHCIHVDILKQFMRDHSVNFDEA